jgi:NADPH-dependent F420 reductase
VIAILGGTGEEGLGLAVRFAAAGESVFIGSRSLERASAAVARVREIVPEGQVEGAANADVAAVAETVFVSLPFGGVAETIADLRDVLAHKLVVSIVVPMSFGPGGARSVDVPEGSAAEQIKAILGPESRVVSGFQNLSAHELMTLQHSLDSDVIICGGSQEDRSTVIGLAGLLAGCRGIDGGPLRNSRYVEDITVLLVGINRRYKAQSGIRLVNIP